VAEHNTENCQECKLNFSYERGCQAFTDCADPILNDENNCQAKITDAEEYQKLKERTGRAIDVLY